MNKIKVMTIVGTRPEIIKLSEIIKKCDIFFNQILVHTGQNYDYYLNELFFKDLNLREPNYYLSVPGDDLGETVGNIMKKAYSLMKNEQPDAILVLGDTNSGLSTIMAKRRKIPIFHLEAGNRCYDENLPEEINRRIIDHISDINLCYTEHARRNLLSEGLMADRVFVVGTPMREVINNKINEIDKNLVLDQMKLKKNNYILLSAHREENMDNESNFKELIDSINEMAKVFDIPIIYSLHPRSEKIIKSKGIVFDDKVKSMKPFSLTDYLTLQKNALCVVSDSGTLAEESSILKFPAVSFRTSTERPEAVEKGNMLVGGIKKDQLINSIKIAIAHNDYECFSNVNDYKDCNVSRKVVQIIQGYTEIVNKRVWNKNG